MLSRRTLLKTGALGALLLAGGGLAAMLLGRDAREDRASVLHAVAPVLLDGALPARGPGRDAALARCIDAVGAAIEGMPPAVQDELAQLFALLAIAPTRLLTTGIAGRLEDAEPARIAVFLSAWRTHRVALLQSAYQALHDLTAAAWYADESTWASTGYSGPPRL